MGQSFATSYGRLACAACCATLCFGAAFAADRFKLTLRDDGVYRVDYEELGATAPLPGSIDSRRLALRVAGEAVPLWIVDGGDGVWGPGDWIEFVGRHRSGRHGYYNEFSPNNVYRLELDAAQPERSREANDVERSGACTAGATGYRAMARDEENRLRVRFSAQGVEEGETWFWAKLTHVDSHPFSHRVDLADLDPEDGEPARMRIGLRGWSSLPPDAAALAADHRLVLSVNGKVLGKAEWDNSPRGYVLDLALAPKLLTRGVNRIELSVPQRRIGGDPRPRIDAVLLDWIEVSYGRGPRVTSLPARVRPHWPPGRAGCLILETASDLVIYGESGNRFVSSAPHGRHAIPWPVHEAVHVVKRGELRRVPAIRADHPSSWSDTGHRADLIIIAHRRLLEAVRPLEAFHRGRGLKVAVVDVEDLYDEYSHGLLDPQAIRDFLADSAANWRHPAPRYVLLVGDASWDPWSAGADDGNYADWTYRPAHAGAFGKNDSTPYRDHAERNHRNLIPTWSHATREGHAASDHWFVDFGPEPGPRMAIGRWPVTEPEEVRSIVEKTVRYSRSPEPGAWRHRAVWITNEARGYQQRSDRLVRSVPGLEALKIYPSAADPADLRRGEAVIEALNEGGLFVHFLGHGGRYIWRTGPPDLSRNHDLFTLDDLDRLAPNTRLPIVFSMTCYSAPFDHPNADSIGEKFLRIGDRGAVAVVAASWRNSPTERMSRLLLEEFSAGGTIGDAFVRAKRRSEDPDFLHTYNLLGDPATPIALEPRAVRGNKR